MDQFNEGTESIKIYTTALKDMKAANRSVKYTFADIGSAVNYVAHNYDNVTTAQVKFNATGENIRASYNNLKSALTDVVAAVDKFDKAFAANDLEKKEEKKLAIRERYLNRFVKLLTKKYTEEQAHNELLRGLDERRDNVLRSVNTSMEEQMLSLIENRKFSVRALKDAVFQEVRIELAGFAAKAAVRAIYFTALGFAKLAQWNLPAAGAAFKSAAGFALVSGATIAAASAFQKSTSGNNSGGSSVKSIKPANSLKSAVPVSSNVNLEPSKLTQQIKVVINNPLSDQNWQKIAEDNIAPALRDLQDRNIEVIVMNT